LDGIVRLIVGQPEDQVSPVREQAFTRTDRHHMAERVAEKEAWVASSGGKT